MGRAARQLVLPAAAPRAPQLAGRADSAGNRVHRILVRRRRSVLPDCVLLALIELSSADLTQLARVVDLRWRRFVRRIRRADTVRLVAVALAHEVSFPGSSSDDVFRATGAGFAARRRNKAAGGRWIHATL